MLSVARSIAITIMMASLASIFPGVDRYSNSSVQAGDSDLSLSAVPLIAGNTWIFTHSVVYISVCISSVRSSPW